MYGHTHARMRRGSCLCAASGMCCAMVCVFVCGGVAVGGMCLVCVMGGSCLHASVPCPACVCCGIWYSRVCVCVCIVANV